MGGFARQQRGCDLQGAGHEGESVLHPSHEVTRHHLHHLAGESNAANASAGAHHEVNRHRQRQPMRGWQQEERQRNDGHGHRYRTVGPMAPDKRRSVEDAHESSDCPAGIQPPIAHGSAVQDALAERGRQYALGHHGRDKKRPAWALFVAAMMTQGVLSAPLSERILHSGAVGYGWLNAGWAVGAFVSVFYASTFIRRHGANRSVTVTMSIIALSLFLLPASHWLALAVPIYFMMGSSRGVGGIALSSEMMQMVPRHFMGRVQNTFSFVASALQIGTSLLAGEAAHRHGLTYGFWIVGAMYLGAGLAAWLPVRHAPAEVFQRGNPAAD